MIKLYLFDIEGTTTDINFVHKELFPYSEKCMPAFIEAQANDEAVKRAMESVKKTVKEEENQELDQKGVIEKLLSWIKTDRKHPALKEIQGLIWDEGYSKNHFKGHVYTDVQPFFKKILISGSKVGIYSSGSVHAQKLIFGYSTEGDLTPLISCYFDTKIGHKRESSSYQNIAKEVGLEPKEIHFFSDIAEELKAAQDAGMGVTQVVREGKGSSDFKSIGSFQEYMDKL